MIRRIPYLTAALLTSALLFLLLAGCGGPGTGVSRDFKRWYNPKEARLPEAPALSGKRIVLDPGHGGAFPGALGRGGLAEKEVNLKVALLLKGMLEGAGARVTLTRLSDVDLLPAPGAHVRDDLARRAAIADSIAPDLFVSIHHNASDTATRSDSTADISKTFYKMGDPGPSLDAASRVQKQFMAVLGLPRAELAVGNYFVLRNVQAPAILGEPSYITHPRMEALLADTARLRIEALAYFLGIAEWFSKGVPRIENLECDTAAGVIRARIESEFPLDTFSIRMALNGRSLPIRLAGNQALAPLPGPLANGLHALSTSAANVNGNLSAQVERSFLVNRDPALMNGFYTRAAGRPGQVGVIRILILDGYGLPVMDGTRVVSNSGSQTVTRAGIALFYPLFSQKKHRITCGEITSELQLGVDPKAPPVCQGFIRCDGKPVAALLSSLEATFRTTADINGFFELPDGVDEVRVTAAGCADTLLVLDKGAVGSYVLEPAAGGFLSGRRIVIDPEFGGTESGGLNRDGIRASDLNRRIAALLLSRLIAAGADAVLARPGDRTVSLSDRVELANAREAELYLVLRSDTLAKDPYIAIYPNSKLGGLLARHLRDGLSLPKSALREEISYITQQTPCTAAIVSASGLHGGRASDAGALAAAAAGLYRGVVSYFGDPGANP